MDRHESWMVPMQSLGHRHGHLRNHVSKLDRINRRIERIEFHFGISLVADFPLTD